MGWHGPFCGIVANHPVLYPRKKSFKMNKNSGYSGRSISMEGFFATIGKVPMKLAYRIEVTPTTDGRWKAWIDGIPGSC
jgi:hypothetical protein